MKIYYSKSSALVKTITLGTLILLTILIITGFKSETSYTQLMAIIISVFGVGVVAYFYSNSLYRIILNRDTIILKKIIGKIEIPFTDIINAQELDYSNLTMTYGSKGIFGFIGTTMDNSISLVKDRKKMILVQTIDRRYLFSSENSKKLVFKINEMLNLTRNK